MESSASDSSSQQELIQNAFQAQQESSVLSYTNKSSSQYQVQNEEAELLEKQLKKLQYADELQHALKVDRAAFEAYPQNTAYQQSLLYNEYKYAQQNGLDYTRDIRLVNLAKNMAELDVKLGIFLFAFVDQDISSIEGTPQQIFDQLPEFSQNNSGQILKRNIDLQKVSNIQMIFDQFDQNNDDYKIELAKIKLEYQRIFQGYDMNRHKRFDQDLYLMLLPYFQDSQRIVNGRKQMLQPSNDIFNLFSPNQAEQYLQQLEDGQINDTQFEMLNYLAELKQRYFKLLWFNEFTNGTRDSETIYYRSRGEIIDCVSYSRDRSTTPKPKKGKIVDEYSNLKRISFKIYYGMTNF